MENKNFNHTQVDREIFPEVLKCFLGEVSVEVATEIVYIHEHYNTVDAEIVFNKYFTIEKKEMTDEEVLAELPPIIAIMAKLRGQKMQRTVLEYVGPKTTVPATLVVEGTSETHNN